MMKAWLKIILCLSVSLASASAHAQVPEGAEREFEAAVGQYTENYQRLMQSRGVSAADLARRRRVAPEETQQELAEAFLVRGAPPLSEYVRSSSLTDITAALKHGFPAGTALLFYAYRGEALQIWLVDGTGLRAFSSAAVPRQKLETAIYDLRNALGVDSLQSSRAPSSPDIGVAPRALGPKQPLAQAIADVTGILLPGPIAEQLGPIKRLIVAPILGLGTVPYAILRPFKTDAYLIDRMTVSVVPSLFDIEDETKPWTPGARNPLIVGNPYFPPDRRWKVPPLPGAEDEARAIAGLLNTKPLTGRRATKRAVRARAAGADFLYFATHGVASSTDPLTGGFLFLSARRLTDGFWTAREVQGSRLKAQIAVLSACQTGLGRVHDAGVIGLSRAFQIAGVPRVVMSLWSVNDKATAQLMKAFVKNLRSNEPSEALRLAMLDVRRTRPAPSQWASFVLFGTPG